MDINYLLAEYIKLTNELKKEETHVKRKQILCKLEKMEKEIQFILSGNEKYEVT